MNKRNLYICPSTQVVLVQTEALMSVSDTKATVDGHDELTTDPTPADPSGGKSRKYDIWANPEEEEELQ